MDKPSDHRRVAYHLVMCSFEGTETAARVVGRLREEGALIGCEIEGEALISRDASGQIHYHERGSAGVGAAVGATVAGVLGLVGGPVILPLMLVVGAVAGGVAGHFAGQVLPPEDLRKVGDSLPPGSSAYLSLVDSAHARGVVDSFSAESENVLNLPVDTELSCAIRETITHTVGRA